MAGRMKKKRNIFKRKFTKLMQKKLVILFLGIVLAFAVLVGRITYINASNLHGIRPIQ